MNNLQNSAPTQTVQASNLLSLLPENQELLKVISDLNLDEVARKFVAEKPQFDLDATLYEYRAYLYLCKAEYRTGTTRLPIPNERTDEMWHLHILFLKDYLDFCQNTCTGEIIMHYPHTETHPRMDYDIKRELLKPLQIRHFGFEVFDMGQAPATSYSGC
jgi:hypothetical protein